MIRSQAKIIDDLENCYNALAISLVKSASFYYNSGIRVDKETILETTARALAASLEPLLEDDSVVSVEELNSRLLRIVNADINNNDDSDEILNELYRALKEKFDTDKKLDTYTSL
jgi:hypothetical protein